MMELYVTDNVVGNGYEKANKILSYRVGNKLYSFKFIH